MVVTRAWLNALQKLLVVIAIRCSCCGADAQPSPLAVPSYADITCTLFASACRWTEIGNSGIFRPEMLVPMGLPRDVRVIAWGLSLERPTMIKYRCG